MPFVPNMPRAEAAAQRAVDPQFVAWPFVDELYDYTQLLGPGKTLGTLPQSQWGQPVGIVGAGPAGMLAAYELLKMGLEPIVLEASDRIGGRNWSDYFTDGGNPTDVIAEMGAMRVPTQNKIFYYYADLFGLTYSAFPDPGDVPTVLYYENQVYDWQANQPSPPGPFKKIKGDFNGFVGKLVNKIYAPWQQGNMAGVQKVWQQYIDHYKSMSFFEGLAEGLPHWKTEQFNAFGALGMGSGGFGPLYGVGFLELLRILVNQFEQDQQLVQYGISGLTDGFYTSEVTLPNGKQASLSDLECVRLSTEVTGIEINQTTGNPVVYWASTDGSDPPTGRAEFPAVIVATTTRSMEMMGLTIAPPSDKVSGIISEEEKVALRNLHLMESSKMFIRTAEKFWMDNGQPRTDIPQNIQTDELPRGIYCLDYPQTDNGVVLISYTWGDDSAKLLALPPAKRLAKLREVIAAIHPEFASYLDPVDDQIYNVDWEAMPYYYGAFKLQDPGEDPYVQDVFFQYQSALDDANDPGVYLAGDSVSWAGGWTEGALHTGLNAATAVAYRLGAKLPSNSPMTIKPNLYTY
jgi:tryptophan 2-monooxygenase